MRYMLTIFLFIAGILFGVCMIVYGGYDDSPGGQLLGLTILVASIFGVVKKPKRQFESD